MQQEQTKKGGFTSGIGFVLAAAGSAVGLGNLWAFPYKAAENGGAAFVFLYVACVLFIGAITMICEMFIGKRAQANPVTAFKGISKKIGWVGLLAIAVPTIICIYYSVLGGYTVRFTANAFSGNANNFAAFAGSGWPVILFTALFLAFAIVVVMAGVKGGIEKASKVLMPALFVLLVAVVIFVLCLGEGVSDGLKFFLVPDFSKVTFGSVLAAMGQAFYSLSLGMGTMIVYGSYTGKEINMLKSTAMICIFDTVVALLAGLAIFPAVFHFAAKENDYLNPNQLQGMTLMFDTLPKVFESIGFRGNIIEFLFFAMVVIAAVTSVISIMEVSSQFIIQKYGISRKKATACIAAILFVLSIPVGYSIGFKLNGTGKMTVFGLDWLSFLDTVTNTVLMPVCALLACVAVGWIMGPKRALAEMEEHGVRFHKFSKVVAFMLRFVVPVLIAVIEVFGIIDLVFPMGSFNLNGLGIVLVAYGILGILIGAYFLFYHKTETGTNADELLKP